MCRYSYMLTCICLLEVAAPCEKDPHMLHSFHPPIIQHAPKQELAEKPSERKPSEEGLTDKPFSRWSADIDLRPLLLHAQRFNVGDLFSQICWENVIGWMPVHLKLLCDLWLGELCLSDPVHIS